MGGTMNLGETLTDNVKSWGVLAVVVVVMSLLLLKFKTSNVGSITCPNSNATYLFYNATSNTCCYGTSLTAGGNCSIGSEAIGSVATNLDTFVTGLSEPKNWVIIAIIALVGFGILRYFSKQSN